MDFLVLDLWLSVETSRVLYLQSFPNLFFTHLVCEEYLAGFIIVQYPQKKTYKKDPTA